MDYARLEREVLYPFLENKHIIRYGHFDAKNELISNTIEIKNCGVLIVEGVGLFRPEFTKYFAYKIWVDVPIEEAIARGKKEIAKSMIVPMTNYGMVCGKTMTCNTLQS